MSISTRRPDDDLLLTIFKAHLKVELESQLMEQIMPTVKANVAQAAEAALKSTEVIVAQQFDFLKGEMITFLLKTKEPT